MASSGGVQQRLPSRLDPPIGFAHRGAKAHAPENTIAAFQLALRLGATGLESDVWLTAEGIPVLDHDGVVRRGRAAEQKRGSFALGLLEQRSRDLGSGGVDVNDLPILLLVKKMDTI